MRVFVFLLIITSASSAQAQIKDLAKTSNRCIKQSRQHLVNDELNKAIAIANKGLELSIVEHSFDFNLLIGLAQLQLGDYDKALSHLHTARELETHGSSMNKIELYWAIGNCYIDQNDPASTVKYYKEILTLDPDHEEAKVNIGKYLVDSGRTTEGLSYLDPLINAGTKYESMARLSRAYAYLQLVRYEEAESDLFICEVLEPKNPYVHMGLVSYYYLTKNNVMLCEAVAKAKSLDHSLYEYHSDLQELNEIQKKFCSK